MDADGPGISFVSVYGRDLGGVLDRGAPGEGGDAADAFAACAAAGGGAVFLLDYGECVSALSPGDVADLWGAAEDLDLLPGDVGAVSLQPAGDDVCGGCGGGA